MASSTLRVVSAEDIDRALSVADAVDAMRSAFSQLSDGRANVPIRGAVESEHGLTLLMPAFLGGSRQLGAKIVSVFPDSRDGPPIRGAVLLLDSDSGAPKALLDGTRLTALRTAAGSALATELLAAPEASVLAVFGAGVQARSHIEVISATRPLTEIRVCSRTAASAVRLVEDVSSNLALVPPGSDVPVPVVRVADSAADAVSGADLIVAATTSSTPVFPGGEVATGTHINGVGSFKPSMQEVGAEVVRRARVVVDQREAAWEEAGDLIAAVEAGEVGRDVIDCELGDIVNGVAPRGRADRDLTFFKSVGNAAQDIAIAELALARAEAAGRGSVAAL